MGDPHGYYIDEDLLDVARVLLSARRHQADVHRPGCRCGVCPARGELDRDWLPRLADQRWAIITHDGFRKPGERQDVIDYGLGVFRLRWRDQISSWERITLVFRRWDDIRAVWSHTPRPFIARVYRSKPVELTDL